MYCSVQIPLFWSFSGGPLEVGPLGLLHPRHADAFAAGSEFWGGIV